MLAGIVSVILMYLGAAGIFSVAAPAYINTGDQTAHVDYIYRIYHDHKIPRYYDGLRYQPLIDQGASDIYQRAAGHPPLFHLIHAPFVGPFLEQGEWKKAIAVGRIINLGFGVLCVIALAWAGYLLGGNRKYQFALAVPALSVMTYRFLRLNLDYALDSLLTLWTTLTLIILVKIIRHGLKSKYLVPLGLVSSAGLLTKGSYLAFIPLSGLVLFVKIIEFNWRDKKVMLKKLAWLAGLSFLVVVSGAWYYYLYNYKENGNWFGPLPPTFTGGRTYKSLGFVLYSPALWAIFYARYAVVPFVSVAIHSFAVAGYLAMENFKLKSLKIYNHRNQIIAVLALAYAGIALSAFKLSLGYGTFNFRYILPAILPLALFLAYGLLEFKRARGGLVTLSAVMLGITAIISIKLKLTPEGLLQGLDQWAVAIGKLYKSASGSPAKRLVITALLLMFGAGGAGLGYTLYRLTGDNSKSSPLKPSR